MKARDTIKQALHNWIDSLQGKQLIENIHLGKDISKEIRAFNDVISDMCSMYEAPKFNGTLDEEAAQISFNKAEEMEESTDDFNPKEIGKDAYDKDQIEDETDTDEYNEEVDEDSDVDFTGASTKFNNKSVTNDIVGEGPEVDFDKIQKGEKNNYNKSDDFENVGPAGMKENGKGVHKIEAKFIETAAIKPDSYDWHVYNGKRKKKFNWGNKEWKLGPTGVIGLSPKCDLRGKHKFVIIDESRSQALEISEHEARLLKARCLPFEGDVKALLSTSPNSGGRSVTAGFSIIETAKKIGLTVADLKGMNSNQFGGNPEEYLDTRIYGEDQADELFEVVVSQVDDNTFEYSASEGKKIAFKDAIKYFSKLFDTEPDQDLDETQPVIWDTDEGSVTLKYAPPSRFVVSYKGK